MTSKEVMIKELEKLGVELPKGLSIPEIKTLLQRAKAQMMSDPEMESTAEFGRRKKDMMASLSGLQRMLLVRIVSNLGEIAYKSMTKGDLLLMIRSMEEKTDQKVLSFGKYKGHTFLQTLTEYPSYCQWAMAEMRRQECSPQLREFGTYSRLHYTRGFQDWQQEVKEEAEEKEEPTWNLKKEFKGPKVKEEEEVKKPESKATGSKNVPVPDSDLEEEEDDAEDAKKKKKVSARPVRRPENFTLESDSSATSWMELADKRKHPGKTTKK
jgi:hypothetical protein